MSKRPRKRRKPAGGRASGKAQSWAGRVGNDTPGCGQHQVFAGFDKVAQHLRRSGRLAVVFALTSSGRIDDDAIVMHGDEPLGIVPVPMLAQIADALPSLDSAELRQSIATYHAEQSGIGGRA